MNENSIKTKIIRYILEIRVEDIDFKCLTGGGQKEKDQSSIPPRSKIIELDVIQVRMKIKTQEILKWLGLFFLMRQIVKTCHFQITILQICKSKASLF